MRLRRRPPSIKIASRPAIWRAGPPGESGCRFCYYAGPMRRQDFHYDLPPELIAQRPPAKRTAARLLCLDGADGAVADRQFTDFPTLVGPDDLLVFNDTRVIPARLFGRKASGGKLELLVERILDEHSVLAHLRASKAPGAGTALILEPNLAAVVEGREGSLFRVRFDGPPVLELLEEHGHMPLPPYVERADEAADRDRYQTVFAQTPGAVAAPTAGLHFDAGMLERLDAAGIRRRFVTLHVGAGTFQPVRVDDIRKHHMHSEYAVVNQNVVDAVAETRARGGRVIAIGTTAVRSLESAAAGGQLRPFADETQLFIFPGYQFRVVDAMLTNFHLPESTLLMLVSAFAGRDAVLAAYRHAVAERYRFFSYGDAMFITPQPGARG